MAWEAKFRVAHRGKSATLGTTVTLPKMTLLPNLELPLLPSATDPSQDAQPLPPLLGQFIHHGEAFLLTHPQQTPRPWANFCFNDFFYIGCDQFGRSMSHLQDGKGNWCLPVITKDEFFFSGDKGIYIRDDRTEEFWDAGWSFTQKNFDRHEVELRPGEVIIRHLYREIEAEWSIFVAPDQPVECWELTLRNTGSTRRPLSIYPFQLADLSGYSAPAGTGAGRTDSYTRGFIHPLHNAVVCRTLAPFIQFDRHNLLLAADLEPVAYETAATTFLGLGRQFASPAALKRPTLSNQEAAGHQLIAALQLIIELAPGESRTIRTIAAAVSSNQDDVAEYTERYLSLKGWEKCRAAMLQRRLQLRQAVHLETPDPYVNALANYWLPQQVSLCGRFSRGWGHGYRDSLQDARALCLLEAPYNGEAGFKTARRILEGCLAAQYNSGGTPRKWLPLSREDYSDGPAWLVDAVLNYVEASGDTEFLNAEYPFLDGDPAPVHEHLARAAGSMLNDRGRHGLVRIRGGDWNDGITGAGRGGEGESVFNTQLLLGNLLRMFVHVPHLSSMEAKSRWLSLIEQTPSIQESLTQQAWDGDYFLRAYDDNGAPLGSQVNTKASMYLEPQAFALISGSASHEQAEKLMESVRRNLETAYGCRLLSPAYDEFDPDVGRVSAHIPGTWENGAVYCHATAFYIHGLCKYGHADKAFDLFTRLTGGNPNHPSSVSGVEPYAMTNCFAGPENPAQPGASRAYWFTGTAGWTFRYLHEVMPNLVPQVGGVQFGYPAFPSIWNQVKIKRIIRGKEYHVSYTRDSAMTRGNIAVTLNGRPVENGWIADAAAVAENEITVRFA